MFQVVFDSEMEYLSFAAVDQMLDAYMSESDLK